MTIDFSFFITFLDLQVSFRNFLFSKKFFNEEPTKKSSSSSIRRQLFVMCRWALTLSFGKFNFLKSDFKFKNFLCKIQNVNGDDVNLDVNGRRTRLAGDLHIGDRVFEIDYHGGDGHILIEENVGTFVDGADGSDAIVSVRYRI